MFYLRLEIYWKLVEWFKKKSYFKILKVELE